MAKQKRISVSFSREYSSEYSFLTGLTNSSDFICKAVREKIQHDNQKAHDLEEYIRGIIESILSEKAPTPSIPLQLSTQRTTSDQDLINAANLFEL